MRPVYKKDDAPSATEVVAAWNAIHPEHAMYDAATMLQVQKALHWMRTHEHLRFVHEVNVRRGHWLNAEFDKRTRKWRA